jgi:hypothetical protein
MKLEVEDLKKIHMLPGETLVVRCKMSVPRLFIKNFCANFESKFPKNKLILITEGMEIYKLISEEKE